MARHRHLLDILLRRHRHLHLHLLAIGTALSAMVALPGSSWAQSTTPAPSSSTQGTPSPASSASMTSAPLPTAQPALVPAIQMPQTEADLRVLLDTLLQEHTYLAGNAIAPVIGGDQAQAQAAATVLDENTQQLGGVIGQLYGPQAQQAFLTLWRRHIADYVEYAQAGLNNDTPTQAHDRQDLLQFAQDTDTFLTGVNPDIPSGSIAQGLTMHVHGTLQVIDALEAKDYLTAFNLAKEGADMSAGLGDPLASAIAQQMPDQFSAGTPAPGE